MKKTILIFLFIFTLANFGLVSANGEHSHEEQSLIFPAWTYYAEIAEHSLMIIIGVVAILFLSKPYKIYKGEVKQGILWMIMGLTIFIFAQLLTNLHHFLVYPFGIWNAIIHHGLYVMSIAIIIMALFKVLKGVKK